MKLYHRFFILFFFNGVLLVFIIFIYNLSHLLQAGLNDFKTLYPSYYEPLIFLAKNCSAIITVASILFVLFNFIFIFKKWRLFLWKKEIALALLATVLTLCLAEWGLRLCGFIPGQSFNKWFIEVDNLVVYKGFDTDSSGIFMVDQEARKYLSNELAKVADKNRWEWDIPGNVAGEIYTVKNDFFRIHHGIIQNSFSGFIAALKEKPLQLLDQFEKSVLDYSYSPINEAGFKSISFADNSQNRKKILLLGDSFTWGHNTPNITNGFADILLSKGYVVYNTGISGTDPSQYLAIAKKYIPILKPDFVIVNFYLGNDVFYFERPVLPHAPMFIATNAGNLMTCPMGKYILSPDSLYRFNVLQNRIPVNGNKFYELCAKSVVMTLGWHLLNKLNITFYDNPELLRFWAEGEASRSTVPAANFQIKQISEIAAEHQASFRLSIIPDLKIGRLTKPDEYENLFTGQEYYMPEKLSVWDYNFRDRHFNKSGHEKYADHLLSIIE